MARSRNIFTINQRGQSAIEYILLIAVISSLIGFVFKSQEFQRVFGEDGEFAKNFRSEIEFSYRHALQGRQLWTQPNYNDTHLSYQNPSCGNRSRFFGAADPYPTR